MHIYKLLIMSSHVINWAFEWAVAGPRPSLGPTVWLLRVLGSWFVVC